MQDPCALEPPLTVRDALSLLDAIGARMRYGLILDARIRLGDDTLSARVVEGRAVQPHVPLPPLTWDDERPSQLKWGPQSWGPDPSSSLSAP